MGCPNVALSILRWSPSAEPVIAVAIHALFIGYSRCGIGIDRSERPRVREDVRRALAPIARVMAEVIEDEAFKETTASILKTVLEPETARCSD